MSGGAPREPRTEPIARRAAERRTAARRTDDRSAAEQLELEAIREAFDGEVDAKERCPHCGGLLLVTFVRVLRTCRNFARYIVARGGRL